jgi:hypothetical protein
VPLDLIASVAAELDTIETSAMGFGRLVACTIVVQDEGDKPEDAISMTITWDPARMRWYVETQE